MFTGLPKDTQKLVVIQLDIVGGEHLEGSVPGANQCREIFIEPCHIRIGQRDVKRVIDHRAARGSRSIIGDRVCKGLPADLRGK